MTPWISHSEPSRQALYSGISAGLGALLLIAILAAGNRGENALAGGLLGGLLLAMGVAGFFYVGTQTITVDPQQRRILVYETSVMGAKDRAIPFAEVERVHVGYLGKRSNYVGFYYLVLTLRSNGEEYPLFAPGRGFEGASSRETVEGWRGRLEAYLQA